MNPTQRRSPGSRQRWVDANQGRYFCACGCCQAIQLVPVHMNTGIPRYLHGHNPQPRKPTPDPTPCACGCEELATPGRKYISGHNSRGAKRSAETRRKLSEQKKGKKNPQYGKPAWNRLPEKAREPCACGCRKLAGRGKKYVSGHNTRVEPTKKPGPYVLNTGGYRLLMTPDHPYANVSGYVAEHRLVVERSLMATDPGSPLLEDADGLRVLRRDVVIHHVNGDKQDNRIENLRAMTRAEHTRLHHAQGDIRYG